MANVIFDGARHNELVTIEGKASAGFQPGHVVAVSTDNTTKATTFAKAAYTAGAVVPKLWVADKDFLHAGDVSTAYVATNEVTVRLLASGETAFVRAAAGTYNKGTAVYANATGGLVTATAPAQSVDPVGYCIENIGAVSADALVRIVAA